MDFRFFFFCYKASIRICMYGPPIVRRVATYTSWIDHQHCLYGPIWSRDKPRVSTTLSLADHNARAHLWQNILVHHERVMMAKNFKCWRSRTLGQDDADDLDGCTPFWMQNGSSERWKRGFRDWPRCCENRGAIDDYQYVRFDSENPGSTSSWLVNTLQ